MVVVTPFVGASRVKQSERIITARGRMVRARLKIRRRAPLPRKSACCARERKQITSAAPKFAQILLTLAQRLEKRQVVSLGNIKNRSHRVSTVVSRSTIFFHRDRISPGINPTLMSAAIQIEMADILRRRHPPLQLPRCSEETLLGALWDAGLSRPRGSSFRTTGQLLLA